MIREDQCFSPSAFITQCFLTEKKWHCVATSAFLPKLVLMFVWTYPTWHGTDDSVTVIAHSQGLAKYWASCCRACCCGCLPGSSWNTCLKTTSFMVHISFCHSSNKSYTYIPRVISINTRKCNSLKSPNSTGHLVPPTLLPSQSVPLEDMQLIVASQIAG